MCAYKSHPLPLPTTLLPASHPPPHAAHGRNEDTGKNNIVLIIIITTRRGDFSWEIALWLFGHYRPI